MSKEDIENIKKGYHSMLKVVEDLVATEGKNIKEAFATAEDKLSEWGELGREEASSISDEVQHDIDSLGETIEEAKQSFKEKWELDSKYLSDATWESLSNVADKTTLALMEFRKELQEKAEEATKDLHKREHQDHRKWHSEHEMWLDDIKMWQNEYAKAEQSLDAIKESISKRSEQLDIHANNIKTHEYIDQVHEKDIARSERDPDNPAIEVINNNNEDAYEEMIQRHQKEADAHIKFKEDHRRVMSLIAKLNKLA